MTRNVKGILFADYVRMIRAYKQTDWTRHLPVDDMAFLSAKIAPDAWYPMASFERLGNAILAEIAHGDLVAVRMWGHFSLDSLCASNPTMVVPNDPIETLMRFRVLRSTFFDFAALEIPMLVDGNAQVLIHYHMGPVAEEAASHQTMGFFERLLEMAGATSVYARLKQRSWTGDPRTLLELSWRSNKQDTGEPHGAS